MGGENKHAYYSTTEPDDIVLHSIKTVIESTRNVKRQRRENEQRAISDRRLSGGHTETSAKI